MFKTDEQIDKLLNHKNNSLVVTHKTIGSGNHDNHRINGKKNPITVPEKVDAVIFSHFFGIKPAAELINKQPAQISSYRRNPEVKDTLKLRIGSIQDKVLDKVDAFLDMVSSEKDLSDSIKAATVAEKVVNVYERLAPKIAGPTNQVQVVFYAPKLKPAAEYPIVEVEG